MSVDVLLQEQENPDFIEPGVVGAEFTTGTEFSRIYGKALLSESKGWEIESSHSQQSFAIFMNFG